VIPASDPLRALAIAPPSPTGPTIRLVYGAYDPNGTPGTVYGSGFANPQGTVAVSGSGEINPPPVHGNILSGIPVQTPCVNKGQTIKVAATSNSGETAEVQSLCPDPT
jgi:hypothetical protein